MMAMMMMAKMMLVMTWVERVRREVTPRVTRAGTALSK